MPITVSCRNRGLDIKQNLSTIQRRVGETHEFEKKNVVSYDCVMSTSKGVSGYTIQRVTLM